MSSVMTLKRYPSQGGMTFGKIGARPLVKSWTARDYVQNGLVCLYNSKENAGWGQYNANATEIVDLMGNFPSLTISRMVGNEAAVETNLASYMKDQTYTADWGVDHPYTHEMLYRTASYATDDYFTHLINESYMYRQFDYFLWPILVKSAGGVNKYWPKTQQYPPSIQTGPLHTISMSNPATSLKDAKMFLNGTQFTDVTSTTSASISTIRNRVTLAAQQVRYTSYYGCIRFYSRALSADEIAYNTNVDRRIFNLP